MLSVLAFAEGNVVVTLATAFRFPIAAGESSFSLVAGLLAVFFVLTWLRSRTARRIGPYGRGVEG